MAEPHALYGMCSKADTYTARETCMDLSMAMYLRSSLAAVYSPRMVNVFSSLQPAMLRSSQGMYSAGHVGARRTSALFDAGRMPERACGTLDRSPGVFCRMIRMPILVWAISCHLMGSERNIAAVWGGLSGNEVSRFLAQAGGPHEWSGPIGAPDSDDDVWIRHCPSPRAAGPIKVGAVPLARSVCVSCSSTPPPRLRPHRHRHDPPPAPRLCLLVSAHTMSTPPAYLIPPTAPPSPSGLRPFSTQALPSRAQSPHLWLGPEATRPLSGTAPRSIPPQKKTCWWKVVFSGTQLPRS
uniref:Uncharacterized protein n=1 Tax=Eptatretus burgeri TaxID=7764 RepID=A0A8C4Q977_EPTBU